MVTRGLAMAVWAAVRMAEGALVVAARWSRTASAGGGVDGDVVGGQDGVGRFGRVLLLTGTSGMTR